MYLRDLIGQSSPTVTGCTLVVVTSLSREVPECGQRAAKARIA